MIVEIHAHPPVFVQNSSMLLEPRPKMLIYFEMLHVCLKQQVLGLVTPNPTEVIRASALRFPDLNRSLDFLPCEN